MLASWLARRTAGVDAGAARTITRTRLEGAQEAGADQAIVIKAARRASGLALTTSKLVSRNTQVMWFSSNFVTCSVPTRLDAKTPETLCAVGQRCCL